MMLISFQHTGAQVCDGTKTVTRRFSKKKDHAGTKHTAAKVRAGTRTATRPKGFAGLTPGTLLLACVKTRAVLLKDREELAVIRVVSVRREQLRRPLDDPVYGAAEIRLEGFEDDSQHGTPEAWVRWFCRTHKGCTPESNVTRIEFEKVGPGEG